MTYDPTAPAWSPKRVRDTQFSQRLRGYDEAEVQEFQHEVAAQLQRCRDEQEGLRAEITRLEAAAANEEVQTRAVELFSQAQTIADQLITEAVQNARDLMMAARAQQREILGQADEAASNAAAVAAQSGAAAGTGAGATSPDLAYVQTYAKVAAVQLRSVLDALAEQVDKLSELPRMSPAAIEPPRAAQSDSLTGPFDGPDVGDNEPLIWASMMPRQPTREPGW